MFTRTTIRFFRVAAMLLTWIIFNPKWPASKATSGQMIIAYLKRACHLMTGASTAEEPSIEIGSKLPPEQELTMENKARELSELSPKNLNLRSEPDRETLPESFLQTLEPVRSPLLYCLSATEAEHDQLTEDCHAPHPRSLNRRKAQRFGFVPIVSHWQQAMAAALSGSFPHLQFVKRISAGCC